MLAEAYRKEFIITIVDLSSATLLGHGNGRNCYVHPLDDNLVIKVRRQDRVTRDQNTLEWRYLSSLARRGVPFHHIPRLHGWVDTTLGEGLVFERIADHEGHGAPALTDAVCKGLITRNRAEELLKDLQDYLLHYWIVFADTGGGNLVLQQDKDGSSRLVMIDGLGGRNPGLRLWLRSRIPYVARRKTLKHWPRLLGRVRASSP